MTRLGYVMVTCLTNERLTTTVFSAQQQLVDFMAGHLLNGRYIRLDAHPSQEQTVDLGLDLADERCRMTLLGLADGVFQTAIGKVEVRQFLAHHGERQDYSALLS